MPRKIFDDAGLRRVLKRVPFLRGGWLQFRRIAQNLIPDLVFIYWVFYRRTGTRLCLNPPVTFSEKIQWIKLRDRNPKYANLADKYAVRDYVRRTIGEFYLIPLVGVWERPEQIPFASLPEAFILKGTHGSGWNIICPDRDSIDVDSVRSSLHGWLSSDYYEVGREWVYKGIPPRIIAEELLITEDGSDLKDYKFFCFNGEPKYIQVDIDRQTDHRRLFYDLNWKRMPFSLGYPPSAEGVLPPENLQDMIAVARKLSEPLRFARVDLYSHGGRTLFGEITFYPGNGMEKFDPPEYDRILGDMLHLDTKKDTAGLEIFGL